LKRKTAHVSGFGIFAVDGYPAARDSFRGVVRGRRPIVLRLPGLLHLDGGALRTAPFSLFVEDVPLDLLHRDFALAAGH
jgi:hypothetical protein